MGIIKDAIDNLPLYKKHKIVLTNLLTPISDEELNEIIYGKTYYYADDGIGTWDIDNTETINEDEISS